MINKLQTKLKEELKLGNKTNVNTYRNMIGKLKAFQIDSNSKLTTDDCIKILQGMTKQIKESINQFQKGGRDDLVESEKNELIIIESYLPKQLSKDKMKYIIQNIINENNASNISDLGKVMGLVMNEISGRGDGKIASQIARELLSK